MPASQATTSFWTSTAVDARHVRPPVPASLDSALFWALRAWAAASSSSSPAASTRFSPRPKPSSSEPTAKLTTADSGDAEQHAEVAAPRRHRHVGEDAARRRRGDQAGAGDMKVATPAAPPAIAARISLRLHQHVREVDLVDAAEELDDDRGRARSGAAARAEEEERQQDAEAGAGVRLDHEQDRLALLGGLGRTERAEHAVVDGVVEEQHLGRLDQDRRQRAAGCCRPASRRRRRRVGELLDDRADRPHADAAPCRRR